MHSVVAASLLRVFRGSNSTLEFFCSNPYPHQVMQAFQLIAHGQPGTFELRECPDPTPGPDDVVVQVHACGLNHLDLWVEQGALPIPVTLPRTPGCEIAGKILDVGSNVRGWHSGEHVAIQSNLFCGKCSYCQQGDESLCLNAIMIGVESDGGFAEKVSVNQRALVRLPSNVDFQTSAALSLAGSTAMHMLQNRVNVRPGHWVLVMGAASGVGSVAIQIAKTIGAHVIATASNEAKRKLAQQLGADFVVDSTQPKWPSEVRRITEKRGVDIAVEHVGGDVLPKVFQCLARDGTVVTCGATAGSRVTLDLWPLFVKQQRLIGSYSRDSSDLKATLQWAAEGKLKPVINKVFPLHQTGEAFAALRNRTILGKVIVSPTSPEPAEMPQ
jgi:2-desacetyl-2-hydroxyethyl bacteriochlorophyllide A dehydrogenase